MHFFFLFHSRLGLRSLQAAERHNKEHNQHQRHCHLGRAISFLQIHRCIPHQILGSRSRTIRDHGDRPVWTDESVEKPEAQSLVQRFHLSLYVEHTTRANACRWTTLYDSLIQDQLKR